MDHGPVKEKDTVIDIESFVNSGKVAVNLDLSDDQVGKVGFLPMVVVELGDGENEVGLPSSIKHSGEGFSDPGNVKKDSRSSRNAKKPPKPPRPPRGLSVDAADQRLLREISDLAMIKRARIERLKALKKMKAGKGSSSPISSSSSGNFVALLFTALFFVLIVFQGCHSSLTPATNNPAIRIHGSSESSESTYGSVIVTQQRQNSSRSNAPLTSAGSPSLIQLGSGSDIKTEEETTMDTSLDALTKPLTPSLAPTDDSSALGVSRMD